jgi:hypothetical protein
VAAAIDAALDAGGELLALAPAPKPDLLEDSVRDSRRLAQILCAKPAPEVADGIGARTAQLAVDYLGNPPRPMLEQSLDLRRAAVTALRRARAATADDLALWIGHLSGILAYAALDLGQADAALAHADASPAATSTRSAMPSAVFSTATRGRPGSGCCAGWPSRRRTWATPGPRTLRSTLRGPRGST